MARLDFEQTLAAMLRLVGEKVAVSIGTAGGAKPGMVGAFSGTLAGGNEMAAGTWLGVPEEAFYFHFAEDTGAGFFLHAEAFRGAEWHGYPGEPEKALRITSGPLEIVVERDPGSEADAAYLQSLLGDGGTIEYREP